MPAVTTDLDFTTDDLLKFMIQKNLFHDSQTISEARVEAAKAYLNTDWEALQRERWASPGFDPEKPFRSDEEPDWRHTLPPDRTADLATYFTLKDALDEQVSVIRSGPNDEYRKAENALMQCQRVDLWCAGTKEVEAAVKHLNQLGQAFNSLETDFPDFISEYYPGVKEL